PWSPSGVFCRYYSCLPQSNPTMRTILYTISRAEVMDMAGLPARLANPLAKNQPVPPAVITTVSRLFLQCNVIDFAGSLRPGCVVPKIVGCREAIRRALDPGSMMLDYASVS